MGDITLSKIDKIKEFYRRLSVQFESSVLTIIELGEELLDAKKCLDHGQLKPWIEENFPFSYRTAVRYMNVALNKKIIMKQLKKKDPLMLTDAYGAGVTKAALPKKASSGTGAARRGVSRSLSDESRALWVKAPSVPLDRYRILARGGTVLMKTPEMRDPLMICTVTAEPIRGCEDAYEQLNNGLQELFEQYYALIEQYERETGSTSKRIKRPLINVTAGEGEESEETA